MAASATKTNIVKFGTGFPQRFMEFGAITYDSDATVAVDTSLQYIENWSFGEAVTGGSLDMPSLDETFTEAAPRAAVGTDGTVAVDTAANSTRVFTYQFIGY